MSSLFCFFLLCFFRPLVFAFFSREIPIPIRLRDRTFSSLLGFFFFATMFLPKDTTREKKKGILIGWCFEKMRIFTQLSAHGTSHLCQTSNLTDTPFFHFSPFLSLTPVRRSIRSIQTPFFFWSDTFETSTNQIQQRQRLPRNLVF